MGRSLTMQNCSAQQHNGGKMTPSSKKKLTTASLAKGHPLGQTKRMRLQMLPFRMSLAKTSQRCTRCSHSFRATSKPPESCGNALGRMIDCSICVLDLRWLLHVVPPATLQASSPLPRSTFSSRSQGGPCSSIVSA